MYLSFLIFTVINQFYFLLYHLINKLIGKLESKIYFIHNMSYRAGVYDSLFFLLYFIFFYLKKVHSRKLSVRGLSAGFELVENGEHGLS
jgi:hypothetical protein